LAAQSVNAVSVDPPQKIVVQRGQSAALKIHAKVLPGYHANSNKPHEDYLIPLRLTLDAKPLEVEAIEYPKGHDEKYSFSEKPLNVLTGDFDIVVRLKAPASLQPQMHMLAGKLRYQACSDRACLAPKTVELRITADVR
jgi:hypothetical protein